MRRTSWLPSALALKLATYPSFFRMRAISTFSFDEGMSTRGSLARTEFRIRVIMSATGSVMFMGCSYQLALITPGTSPARAYFRKQMRHIWNFRRYPRGRPQLRHRVHLRTANFGLRWDLSLGHVFATTSPPAVSVRA